MMKSVAQRIAEAPSEVREPRAAATYPFSDSESWPGPMDKAAFQGPAGRFVRLVEPHSEADPVGILGQFLGAFSNAAGRSPSLHG